MIETLMNNKNYKVGIYIRLSKEDIDKYHDVSLSVENQIMALENYINETIF
jgi:DNA invertase Pin-like site-specific DNA recombinase